MPDKLSLGDKVGVCCPGLSSEERNSGLAVTSSSSSSSLSSEVSSTNAPGLENVSQAKSIAAPNQGLLSISTISEKLVQPNNETSPNFSTISAAAAVLQTSNTQDNRSQNPCRSSISEKNILPRVDVSLTKQQQVASSVAINVPSCPVPTPPATLPQTKKTPFLQEKSPKKSRQPPNSSNNALQPPLRRGKWTQEEEAYVSRVIADFNSGYLRAPAGTTLRTYLSEKLHCDPMRITKKFTGDACIGKRVFHPAVRCAANAAEIDRAQGSLDALEQRWRKRLEAQQKESSKKSGRNRDKSTVATNDACVVANTPASSVALPPKPVAPINQQAVVTRTATWLDRASNILAAGKTQDNKNVLDVENQMRAVKELLHEGPLIQQSSAGIPTLLENSTDTGNKAPIRSYNAVTQGAVKTGVNSVRIHTHTEDEAVVGTLPQHFSGTPSASSAKLKKSKSENGLSVHSARRGNTDLIPAHDDIDMLPAAKRKVSMKKDSRSLSMEECSTRRNHNTGGIVATRDEECKKPKSEFSPTNHMTSSPVSAASGADVEALVGFLNCVRKESMSGRVDMR